MANIVVCSQYDSVDNEDQEYYASLRPRLINSRHHPLFTNCTGIWDALAHRTVDILILLIRQEQSCCWDVAREIKDNGQLI